jgi:hypothetical protein
VPDDERIDKNQSEEDPAEGRAPVHLRADNFLTFIASTWRLVGQRFGPIFVSFIVGNLLIYATLLALSRTADANTTALGALFYAGQFLLTAVVGGFLAVAAGYTRIGELQERKISVLAGLRKVGDVWGHLTAAALLTGLMAVLLLFAVGLIGLFLGLPLRLGPPVLLFVIGIEKLSLSAAATRTSALIKRNALRTYTYLLMLVLMAMVMLLLGQRLIEIGLDGISLSDLGDALVFTAVTVVLYALLDVALSAGLLVTYADVRARSDEEFSVADLLPETDDA